MNSLATVRYSRKQKRYIVSNGRFISSHPEGEEGKQAALMAAIQHNDPQAHAVATRLVNDLLLNYPSTHGRIWKAAQIVANGHVRESNSNDEPTTIARVKAQSKRPLDPHDRYHYRISRPSKTYYCNCYDYQSNRNCPVIKEQKFCKHVLAVKIMKMLKRPFSPYPSAPVDPRTQWLRDWERRRAARSVSEEEADRMNENLAPEVMRELGAKRRRMGKYYGLNRIAAERERRYASEANSALFGD